MHWKKNIRMYINTLVVKTRLVNIRVYLNGTRKLASRNKNTQIIKIYRVCHHGLRKEYQNIINRINKSFENVNIRYCFFAVCGRN